QVETSAPRRLRFAELRGAFECGRRRRVAAAELRTSCSCVERRGDFLVGRERRQRFVPDMPVGVLFAFEGGGEGCGCSLALSKRRSADQGGAHEWMPDLEPIGGWTDEAARLGGLERVGCEAEPVAAPQHRCGIASVVERRDEQERLRGPWKAFDACGEGGLD